MILLTVLAVLIIVLCILLMVVLTVMREQIGQWTIKWLIRSGSMPDASNPDSAANMLYAQDLAFNLRLVLYFIAAFGIILMLVIIAVIFGIGLFSFLI